MKRNLVMLGGTFSLLILAACGSASTGTIGGASPTPTATPSRTATPAPTTLATPTPTAKPTATPAPSAPATGTATALRSVGALGQILVGGNGRTLYLFLGDARTTSTCNGSCARNWPPLTTIGAPRATNGVLQSLLGTTKRQDGTTQVTYNGHPLYSFIADSAPGMANGEGIDAFGAHWEVINAAGTGVAK
jgi:predicted lipoprotein with Yx(FWY)xxD motif